MITAFISIFVIGGVAWILRRALGLSICPICAGVAGTWGWMLAAHYAGFAVDVTVLGLLMGGSPVGIAYVLEKKLPAGQSPVMWKFLAIPAGFAAMYGLLTSSAPWVIGGAVAWGIIAGVFFRTSNGNNARVSKMEKSLKDCC